MTKHSQPTHKHTHETTFGRRRRRRWWKSRRERGEGDKEEGWKDLVHHASEGHSKLVDGPYKAVSDASGKWEIELKPQVLGTKLSLYLNEYRTPETSLSDVSFGYVFLCTGQSNMEVNTTYHVGGAELIQESLQYKEQLRLTTTGPYANRGGKMWESPTYELVSNFSAVCLGATVNLLKLKPDLATQPANLDV